MHIEDADDLKALLEVLSEAGVRRYCHGDLEVEFQPQVGSGGGWIDSLPEAGVAEIQQMGHDEDVVEAAEAAKKPIEEAAREQQEHDNYRSSF